MTRLQLINMVFLYLLVFLGIIMAIMFLMEVERGYWEITIFGMFIIGFLAVFNAGNIYKVLWKATHPGKVGKRKSGTR